jgi:hypothetical protein
MTRFARLWVEYGRPVAQANVMRFGVSALLLGALVNNFTFVR